VRSDRDEPPPRTGPSSTPSTWSPVGGRSGSELRDGSPVLLRQIRPQDRTRLAEGLRRLSPASRYLRFQRTVTELTDAELAYLTDVDHVDHEAIVAIDTDPPGAPGRRRGALHPRAVRADGRRGRHHRRRRVPRAGCRDAAARRARRPGRGQRRRGVPQLRARRQHRHARGLRPPRRGARARDLRAVARRPPRPAVGRGPARHQRGSRLPVRRPRRAAPGQPAAADLVTTPSAPRGG
jgi:hypothetical protein